MKFPRTLFVLIATALLALSVAACGDDDEASSGSGSDAEAPTDLSGSIAIDGSSTV